VLTKTLITIGIFFSVFSIASADFTPASYNWDGSTTSEEYSYGFSASATEFGVVHTATTSLVGISSITMNLCKYANVGGSFYMVVWYNGTSSPYTSVATSAPISVSDLVTCIPAGSTYIASSTNFILGNTFNATIGAKLYFRIFPSVTGGGAVIVQGNQFLKTDGLKNWYAGAQGIYPTTWNTDYYAYPYVKINTGLPSYSNTWTDLVNSAKADECQGVIECAIAWTFYPDPQTLAQFQSINFASSSPFGYVYDMDDALQTFMTALNATSSSFKLTLDMTTLGNTADVFAGVSTSSITVFDVCWVNRPMGELPADSFKDTFLPIIVFMMWIGLGWLFYSTAHKVW